MSQTRCRTRPSPRRSIDVAFFDTPGTAWAPVWRWRSCPAMRSPHPDSTTTRSPWASPRAIPRQTASCCGPGSRRAGRAHRARASARSRSAGAWPPTPACATSSRGASPWPQPSSRTPFMSRWRACAPGATTSTSSTCGGEESAVGHFRTAPAPHEALREMRFAFVTCQDWPSGYYTAYRDMLPVRPGSGPAPRRLHLRVRHRLDRAAASRRRRASRPRRWTCAPTACATRSTSWIPICRRPTPRFPSR